MAGPLPCDNHPDRLAATLMTDLETGNTLTLCRDCLIQFAEMVVGVSDMPTAELAELTEGAQEVADLVPVAPGPDAEPKSEAQPEAAPPPKAKRQAQAAEETETPSE